MAAVSLSPTHHAHFDGEHAIITHLIRTTSAAGVRTDSISIINFYVALKCGPLAILAGPSQSGKIALVQSLAHVLNSGDPLRCQVMSSRARWAGQSGAATFYAEIQTRLNADKILALIDEAWQPENTDRVFIACLTRISAAELQGFFSDVAFQLRHGQIMRLPSVHLTEPIPYPPNLFLIGTMDTAQFDWLDADLLSQATVIQWPTIEAGPKVEDGQTVTVPNRESTFLRAGIRNAAAAHLKLHRILGSRDQAIQPLHELEAILKRYTVDRHTCATDKALVYIANAWSQEGAGLFDPATPANFAIAADLAIAQTILPCFRERIRHSVTLRGKLADMLNARFPRAVAFLASLDEPSTQSRQVNTGASWEMT